MSYVDHALITMQSDAAEIVTLGTYQECLEAGAKLMKNMNYAQQFIDVFNYKGCYVAPTTFLTFKVTQLSEQARDDVYMKTRQRG